MLEIKGKLLVNFPGKTKGKTTQKTTQKTTRKITQKTTQRILEILHESPQASRREIAEKLIDITEDGVKYQLDKMKKDGLIERIGPAKGGPGKC